ncbi:enoyl-[acyl-carrier protein] reductase/trans-2-enoyl-CoA reductase (NAD+) [Luteibacter rhizovicinus]|uniref:Enoyl-[acyl-carrier-protein] reductase [NADH] n=1 Tax=Luteibacter rhizovicinus TaxID=242606 RepID=A0A4R3YX81_9GAMM|nr:enoyl-ACP reductase FabV [Luteibacter rhizovicinus]TCV96448.1 enoyl-[acyl-carrier protein] reductase/trans-2-enoyl-CoA reductase (NAD+) [Luteibacter rhizovicinus]
MIIHPKVRGFICITAHPTGCEKNVLEQIGITKASGDAASGPKRVLVIGASTGYGLASRITAAFGYGAATLGVFFEKPSSETKTGTAGWYNSSAFDKFAKQAGLYSKSINGDAFSHETRARAIELIQQEMGGPIDLVVYSLASPVRKLPDSGEVVRSSLKTIGETFTASSVDTNRDTVVQVSVEPATEQEIKDTVTVMGGEDWALWIDALSKAGVLAEHAKTVAYSYVGTEITWPIYWHGTLGKAKQHLDNTAQALRTRYAAQGLEAYVGVMKSVVTQASAAIPVIPLYVSMVFRIMKEKGIHEGTIEQINRLFHDALYRQDGAAPKTDDEGRLRLDDWELRDDVQEACKAMWPTVNTENLSQLTDYAGYKSDFLRLFGFARSDVDYDVDVEPNVHFDVVEL